MLAQEAKDKEFLCGEGRMFASFHSQDSYSGTFDGILISSRLSLGL
jgi:hypothetical protein